MHVNFTVAKVQCHKQVEALLYLLQLNHNFRVCTYIIILIDDSASVKGYLRCDGENEKRNREWCNVTVSKKIKMSIIVECYVYCKDLMRCQCALDLLFFKSFIFFKL